MSTVTVSKKYADILAPLGDVQQAVDEALRRYAMERIGQRIADLRRQTRPWEEKYDCTYEVFYAHVTGDEEYVARLRQSHPTWERDFQQWEFYIEEMREWIARLENIGSLGVGVNSGLESPTCWGLPHRTPNELGSPTLWPREIPKSQNISMS